jgi:hypothetical protein
MIKTPPPFLGGGEMGGSVGKKTMMEFTVIIE